MSERVIYDTSGMRKRYDEARNAIRAVWLRLRIQDLPAISDSESEVKIKKLASDLDSYSVDDMLAEIDAWR